MINNYVDNDTLIHCENEEKTDLVFATNKKDWDKGKSFTLHRCVCVAFRSMNKTSSASPSDYELRKAINSTGWLLLSTYFLQWIRSAELEGQTFDVNWRWITCRKYITHGMQFTCCQILNIFAVAHLYQFIYWNSIRQSVTHQHFVAPSDNQFDVALASE